MVDVLVRDGGVERRISASGRDVYAVSALIVVAGVTRLLEGRYRCAGAMAPGQTFSTTEIVAGLEQDGAMVMGAQR